MDWFSYKCQIFGTPITVHFTFFLQLVLGILHSIKNFRLLLSIFIFLQYGPILLITILTHEFGHILATKALGGTTGGIILWPLGGLVQCGSTGRGPSGELKVAIAGPLTHIPQGCIWYGFFYLTTKVFSQDDEFDFHWFTQQLFKFSFDYGLLSSHFLLILFAKAAQLNLVFMVLNLLPMYPLDGGWVLVSSLLLCGHDQNKIGSLVAKAGMALSLICGVLLGIVVFQSALNLVVFGWCFYRNWNLLKLAENERADEHPLFSKTQEMEQEEINNSETVYNVDHAQAEYGQMPTWSNANDTKSYTDSSAQAPWWKLWRGRQNNTVGNQDSQAFLSANPNSNGAVEEDYGF